MKKNILNLCSHKANWILSIFIAFLPMFSYSQNYLVQKPDFGILKNFSVCAFGNMTNNNSFKPTGSFGVADTLNGTNNSLDSVIKDPNILYSLNSRLAIIRQSFIDHRQFELELSSISNEMTISPGGYFIDANLEFPAQYTIFLSSEDINSVFLFNVSGDLYFNEGVNIVLQGEVKPENVFWNVDGKIIVFNDCELKGFLFTQLDLTIHDNLKGAIGIYSLGNILLNETDALTCMSILSNEENSNATICTLICPKSSLINNGSFSNCNNSSFTTNLLPFNPEPPNNISLGHYALVNNTNGVNNSNYGNWSLTDHTGDNGCFLLIDGFPSTTIDNIIWKQTINSIQIGSTYQFMLYYANLYTFPGSIQPNTNGFEIRINNNIVLTVDNANNYYFPNSWSSVCVDWIANNSTVAEIEIRQTSYGNAYHDLGIDDITFTDISLGPDIADAGPDINQCYTPGISLGGVMNECFPTSQNTYLWTPTNGLSAYNVASPILLPVTSITTKIYTVALISGGVTSYSDVEVTLYPSVVLNTYEIQNAVICSGIATEITNSIIPSNGNGTYTYSWSPSLPTGSTNTTTARPTVSLTSGTYNYTVTVYSTGVCSGVFYQNIIVLPPPTPDFYMTENNDDGVKLFTSNNLIDPYNYKWDFGDGTTATGSFIYKTLNGGMYNIKLTATDACNRSATVSKQFDFLPRYSTNYNVSCCADRTDRITFNYTNKDITGSEPWNSTQYPINIRGTVSIKSGAILTITGVTVHFGMRGKIIIEPGGTLILNNSILTGIDQTIIGGSTCKAMWQGIEVWGDEYHSHAGTFQKAYQGKLIMNNGAIIKNAHKAVFVGKRNYCIPGYNCTTTRGVQSYEPGFGGGLVDIQGCIFSNNAIDIEFTPFVSPLGIFYSNGSVIKNNTFSGGTLLDPAYDSDILSTPPYPNAGNIYYAKANINGRSSMQIKNHKINNLSIRDNTFTNAEHGIFSIDSRINITNGTGNGNGFNNLSYGIYSIYTGTTFDYSLNISNNRFNNINQAAIRIDGGRYITIKQNDFGLQNLSYSQQENPLGIYLGGCSNFNITDNNFYRLGEGIRILESGAAGGRVSTNNGTGNLFVQNAKGVVTSGDNSNLEIHCNNFSNPEPNEYTGRNWDIAGILAIQGGDANHTKPAGNEFRPTETVKGLYSSTPFWYFAHAQASDNSFSTLPTGASGSVWNETNYLQNTGFIKLATSCLPSPPCFPACEVVLNNNTAWRNHLEEQYDDVLANLDHNNTENLLITLSNPISSSSALKELLLQHSPLSEIVIASMIDNTNKFTVYDFLSVLEVNMPVSSELWDEAFLPLLAILDTGSATQLKAYQLNESIETLAGLETEFTNALNEQQQIIEQMVIHDMDIDPKATAALLSAQTKENKEVAAATYLAKGEGTVAHNLINEIINEYDYSDWASLCTIQYNLLDYGNSWFGIDSTQEVEVSRIMQESTEVKAKLNAQAVLTLLYGDTFPMLQQQENYSRVYHNPLKKKYEFKNNKSILNLLNPYPNPAGDVVNVPYIINDNNGLLIVSNIYGQEIRKYKLNKGYNLMKIDTSTYPSGIFFLSINDNKQIKPITKKLIIHH